MKGSKAKQLRKEARSKTTVEGWVLTKLNNCSTMKLGKNNIPTSILGGTVVHKEGTFRRVYLDIKRKVVNAN